MTEKELLSQLNNLKKIKPGFEWKKNNRGILLNQIFGAQVDNKTAGFSWINMIWKKLPMQMLRNISQPAMAAVLILVFLLCSSVVSLKAAKNTKPGDSFYIAKIISEKTQFALTFNEKKKASLGIEFAGNRAKEITQVLAELDDEQTEERVEKLVNDFNKEISAVKVRLKRINPAFESRKAVQKEIAEDEPAKVIEYKDTEENMLVFSANLSKEENGIQISEQKSGSSPETTTEKEAAAEKEFENLDVASTTIIETTENASTTVDKDIVQDPQLILEQAGELLDNADYGATLSKLDEAGKVINQIDTGQVKEETEPAVGESENATTADVGGEDDKGEALGVEEEAENSQIKSSETEDSASSTEE